MRLARQGRGKIIVRFAEVDTEVGQKDNKGIGSDIGIPCAWVENEDRPGIHRTLRTVLARSCMAFGGVVELVLVKNVGSDAVRD